MMGGAFQKRQERLGNVTQFAEFNFYMDAGAAWRLLQLAPSCRLVPLDATERRLFRLEELLPSVAAGRRGRLVADVLSYLRGAHLRLGSGDGIYMHDVLAAAVWAGLISAECAQAHVREVVLTGEQRGMIVCNGPSTLPVWYAHSVNENAFLDLWHQMWLSLLA